MKKINKIKKIIGVILVVLTIITVIYSVLVIMPNRDDIYSLKETEKIKFDYVLYQRDTVLYKSIFEELKNELNNDKIDYENYAEYISKLFIVDLYTLSNKVSKDDVGGIQFVKDDIKENFVLNVSNTMYKYVGLPNLDTPEVTSIDLVNIEECSYFIESKEYQGYEISLKWDYQRDYGYDKNGIIYIVKDGEKLFIVEKK